MSKGLCDSCLYSCGDIEWTCVCDKYIESQIGHPTYYYEKREDVGYGALEYE